MNASREAVPADVATSDASLFTASGWTSIWRAVQSESVLRQSQDRSPDTWRRFYDEVADVWITLAGDRWRFGEAVTAALLRAGVLHAGDRVLDIGCGPGTVAIPLAERGVAVTAIDLSARMIEQCRSHAAARQLASVDARVTDWRSIPPGERYDAVVACAFPDALSPDGLARMEALSLGSCAVVVSTGSDPFQMRSRIWRRLMQAHPPETWRHVICLVGYLLVSGRAPHLQHLSWSARLHAPAAEVSTFYRRYFSLIAPEVPQAELEAAVNGEIDLFRQGDFCVAEGTCQAALVWWNTAAMPRAGRCA